ncbi:hypothetical protein [Natrarchaeobaculum sulfurireducens]|uniref:Fido domain-containing protein n=1 Tax=Natrarchaeobaculum sulfurireducens TaxID=2044521 RepID=A0A346PK60_9EURY|nr:hypothetical protein [Natrarchaeobaculum sulfurireducens]AXR79905.1 hypothetical protein AArcMg_4080 [Natrarchaeobaculum sulfurireducens]
MTEKEMVNRVPYHHELDKQFSVDFVSPKLEAVGERVVGYESHKSVKVESFELNRTVYVVYTASGASGAADDIDYDLVEYIDSMEPANAIIATRLVDVFNSILEENYKEEGKRVQAYKDIAAEEIEPALNQIDWSGSAVEVAGRLASNLILKHALPNANHRTAIGICQLYLRRVNPDFSMPETATQLDGADEYDWMEWVNEYINESKRLLTVRRKGGRFKYLEEFGCDVLVRKHDIEISLAEYELDLQRNERWRHYAERHEELWIDFTEEAVRRAGMTELVDNDGLTKHEFADELKGLE